MVTIAENYLQATILCYMSRITAFETDARSYPKRLACSVCSRAFCVSQTICDLVLHSMKQGVYPSLRRCLYSWFHSVGVEIKQIFLHLTETRDFLGKLYEATKVLELLPTTF